jgi:hypothetical protein
MLKIIGLGVGLVPANIDVLVFVLNIAGTVNI